MQESFSNWFRKKKESPKDDLPKPKSTIRDHDSYTDEAMYHLNALHKLSHPNGEWSKINQNTYRSKNRISELHNHINKHLEIVNKRKKAF